MWANETGSVKMLAAKPDDLNLIPETLMVEGRREVTPAGCPQASAHMHTQNVKEN